MGFHFIGLPFRLPCVSQCKPPQPVDPSSCFRGCDSSQTGFKHVTGCFQAKLLHVAWLNNAVSVVFERELIGVELYNPVVFYMLEELAERL